MGFLNTKFTRVIWIVLAYLAVVGVCAPRRVFAGSGHHPVNFSLIPPLSTNRDPDVSTNARLTFLYGRVGAVRGFDVNGIVSVVGGEHRGVQLTGIYSQVDGSFHGLGFTGAVHKVRGEMHGLQVTGLTNFVTGPVRGIQYAGLFNYSADGFKGLQIASFVNLNDGDGRIAQVSSALNATAGDFSGLQLCAGINFANEGVRGLQVALANSADRLTGAQIGLVNVAHEVGGTQIGILNFADNFEGVPIGMVMLDHERNLDWVAYASTYSVANFGLRTRIGGYTATVSLGVGSLQDDNPQSTSYFSWHWGYHWPLSSVWKLGADLGWVHIMPQRRDNPEDSLALSGAAQLRGVVEWAVRDRFGLMGAAGVGTRLSEYSRDASTTTEFIWMAGVSFH